MPAILDVLNRREADLGVAGLIQMLADGDPGAHRVVSDAVGLVAQALGTAVLLLAPDRVIVVGAMARAGDAVLRPLGDEMRRHLMPGIEAPTIVRGLLGDRHTALGAAALVLQHHGWLPRAALHSPPGRANRTLEVRKAGMT